MSKFQRSAGGSYGEWIGAVVKSNPAHKDKLMYVPLLEDGTEDTGSKKVISRSDAPDNIFAGKHAIQVSESGKEITNFHPWNGEYTAKFVRFAAKKDEAPTPKIYPSKQQGGDPYGMFFPIFEIVGGEYDGVEASYRLYYHFKEAEDGTTMLKGGGKSTDALEEFLDLVIGSFDPPKFKDNLLPLFEKMALRANRLVKIVFKKGNIVTLLEVEQPKKGKKTAQVTDEAGDDPPWDDEPETE